MGTNRKKCDDPKCQGSAKLARFKEVQEEQFLGMPLFPESQIGTAKCNDQIPAAEPSSQEKLVRLADQTYQAIIIPEQQDSSEYLSDVTAATHPTHHPVAHLMHARTVLQSSLS
ncbi:hypothetical protein ACN47E_009807 [Coniothyrium glycines]